MKLIQLPNKNDSTNRLVAELASYGLRPQDWVLKPEGNTVYRIENRTEPDFCFEGITKKTAGFSQWQSITLKSV